MGAGRPKGYAKTGGRKKGTPNYTTMRAMTIAIANSFNPFEMLMHFARGDEKALGWKEPLVQVLPDGRMLELERITPQMRLAAIMEACEYVHPKMKSIEHTGDPDNPIALNLVDLVKQLDDLSE